MSDKKQELMPLSPGDMKEVKGGIPYLKPGLIELNAKTSCTTGIHCDSGGNLGESCHTGAVCSSGTHGEPDIDPPPI